MIKRLLLLFFEWLAKWCRKNPLYAKIALFVIILHIGLLLTFAKQKKASSTPSKPTRLAVNTVKLQPRTPKKKAKPKQKKKIVRKKKKTEKKIAKTKAKTNSRRQKLLKEALENLNQIEKAPEMTLTVMPQPSNNLNTDEREKAYFNLLATKLQTSLCLPEHGEVKLRLNLNRQGQIISVDILHAANAQNQQYIENTIRMLQFPPFHKHFPGEGSHAFVIALKSR